MPAEDFSPEFYDPLSTAQLTNTICERFEREQSVSFKDPVPAFEGSGLYAIYYRGTSVELYAPLKGFEIPVYVGQSASHNTSTGMATGEAVRLSVRLAQHRKSIEETGLPLAEFEYRALRVPDVHANLGENGLRVGYKPVWNAVLRGFGSKEQGPTTRKSRRSMWDTVHPGRSRTFGADTHDPVALRTKAKAHIEAQVIDYPTMPWPHPEP